MPIEDLYVLSSELRTAKTGKPYFTLKIRKSNSQEGQKEFAAKIWSESFNKEKQDNDIKVGSVISCYYEEQEHQGQVQLIIEKFNIRSNPDTEKFKPPPAVDTQAVYNKLFLREWKDLDISQFMKNLHSQLFKSGDNSNFTKLMEIPAGGKNHHARRAGLLQHVEEMFDIANKLLDQDFPHYPSLINPEVLYVSIILHDLGKIHEYNPDTLSFEKDRIGAYLGHSCWSAMIVSSLWPKEGSRETMLKIMHCVLSHHGRLEHGAPVHPSIPEAILLHHIDAISAQLDVFRTATYLFNTESKTPEFSKSISETPIIEGYPK